MSDVLEATEIVKFKHYSSSLDNPSKFVITDNSAISDTDDIAVTAQMIQLQASYNWSVSNEVFDQGDSFSISIDSDNTYTYTANSGDGRNEVISGLISLNWHRIRRRIHLTTTEDTSNGFQI